MNKKELLNICIKRNELNFLFNITKIAAENDSIGECYLYCENYTKEMFNQDIFEFGSDKNKEYLEEIGILIYEKYLKHIKII